MTWRLLVAVLGAVPAVTLTPWDDASGVVSRELRYQDKGGAHVVRFTLSKERVGKDGELTYPRRRELQVTHRVGDKEVFKAKDFVPDCEFDLSLEVLEGSIQLTDLDDDGEPEVSFAYKLGCRSDVSPLTAKLLLYEGATKYALRGQSYERVGENEWIGGDFTPDPAFQKGPKAFNDFAQAQWKRYLRSP